MSLRWSALGGRAAIPPLCVEEWCPRRGLYSARSIRQAEQAVLDDAAAAATAYVPAPAIGYEKYRKRIEQVGGALRRACRARVHTSLCKPVCSAAHFLSLARCICVERGRDQAIG
jgi:hypothetical protein